MLATWTLLSGNIQYLMDASNLFTNILQGYFTGTEQSYDCPSASEVIITHYDIIKWKHFPHYWPFVWGIHWSPVNSSNKGQWHGALMFSLIRAGINGWVNNREAGDLRCHHSHYDATVMIITDMLSKISEGQRKQMLNSYFLECTDVP